MAQAAYVPVAVPAKVPSEHLGRLQGIIGIICAVISLLLLPPVFGVAGIVLGVLSLKKGERTLGMIAIILSAVFMVIGMILGVMAETMIEESSSFIFGPVISFL